MTTTATATATATGVAAGPPRSARLRAMVGLLGPHRRLLAAAIASGMVHHLAMLATAATAAWLVGQALTGAGVAQLRPGLVLIGVLVVPVAVAPWAESHLAHVAAFRVLVDVRQRVYEAFERLAPGYLLERRSGDLGAAAISDVEQLEVYFAHTLSPLVVASTVPVAALTVLGILHPALAAALAPVLLLLATVPMWLRRRARDQGTELRGRLAEIGAEVVDTVQGLRELLTFGAGRRQLRRLAGQDDRLLAAKRAHGRRAALEQAATDAISVLGLLAVLVTAAALATGGRLEVALFPVAVVLAATTFAPVIAITDVARDLNLVAAAATRIEAILTAPAPVTDRVAAGPAGPVTAEVSYDRVQFRYAPHLPNAVSEVSFTIAAGETVALVGHSGAGKTTCAHLLLRLWDVSGGAIRIGGHDVRDFPQERLRRMLTFVPQDVYLFNVPLRENIRLGRPDATDAQVQAAATAARAHQFIADLPDGYDTVTGELGARLSGGQRQRIAIARALLADAPILVLDEAVSNLDTTSEAEVTEAMAAARAGRTTLVIAHRLSTIRAADRIVVLADGRVAETGTHAELVTRDGPYRRLMASQLGTADHEPRSTLDPGS